MLTQQQTAWAATHDWFERDNGDGTIVVVDRWFDRDNGYFEERMTWTGSFHELRDWAGY